MAEILGGDKLVAELTRIAAQLTSGASLRVGFLENAKYPDGTPVAQVAAWNNWGTSRAPPRPFFSNMVAKKSPEWPAAIEGLLKTTDYNAGQTLRLTGEAIAGQLRQEIIDTVAPPNAPSTIARKGHGKVLEDTLLMLGSVDYEVE